MSETYYCLLTVTVLLRRQRILMIYKIQIILITDDCLQTFKPQVTTSRPMKVDLG